MPEDVKCALCGHDEAELLFIGRDRLHNVPGEFNLVRCKNCSMVYLNPQPVWTEMPKYYPADYAPYAQGTESPLQRLIQSGGLRRKQRVVQNHKTSGSLLDIGCGSGDFLRYMAQSGGWTVFGIEQDAQAAHSAAQISGAQVFCGRLTDADYEPQSFDIITMWHVMEHLHDPRSALNTVWRWLKPDGRLVLAVPVLDSVDAKLFGPYWSGFDVPRHLFTYSVATLSSMLTIAGFASMSTESFIGGCSAFRISLRFWAEERLKSRFLLRFVRTSSHSLFFRLLMMPYFAVINKLGRGSTLVVTARPAAKSEL